MINQTVLVNDRQAHFLQFISYCYIIKPLRKSQLNNPITNKLEGYIIEYKAPKLVCNMIDEIIFRLLDDESRLRMKRLEQYGYIEAI